VRLVKFIDKVNNNVIERVNGTIRDKVKVMRGFKSIEGANAIMSGFIVHYNFIRPHMSLNGLTPAQASGINLGLNGGNRWAELIKLAVDFQNDGHSLDNIEKPLLGNFIVKVFLDGKEVENPERKLGTKIKFKKYDRVLESVDFYKKVYPKYDFKIE